MAVLSALHDGSQSVPYLKLFRFKAAAFTDGWVLLPSRCNERAARAINSPARFP
jgi:hypothetical protein